MHIAHSRTHKSVSSMQATCQGKPFLFTTHKRVALHWMKVNCTMKDAQGTVLRQSLALYNKLLICGMRLAMLLALEDVLEATREITLAVEPGVTSGQTQCSPRNCHHVPHTALSTSS